MDFAHVAVGHGLPHPREGGVETAVETDLELDPAVGDDPEGAADALGIEIDGFLAEDVLARSAPPVR